MLSAKRNRKITDALKAKERQVKFLEFQNRSGARVSMVISNVSAEIKALKNKIG